MDLPELVRRGRRIRAIGIDDSPFERGRRRDVLVVGAVYSGDEFEGLLSTHVRQDGRNATARLTEMLTGSKFHAQLHLVMLDGVTLGGFNVVDLPGLAAAIQLPCLAVTRRPPDRAAVDAALENLPGAARRQRLLDRAGPVHRTPSGLCFQTAGLAPEVARQVLRRSATRGIIPQCVRAAHLIGSGIVLGESGRRA